MAFVILATLLNTPLLSALFFRAAYNSKNGVTLTVFKPRLELHSAILKNNLPNLYAHFQRYAFASSLFFFFLYPDPFFFIS